ncbi:berberine bridge enzyme-like 13 [Abeliophyllum distichum]|uniref:Berberine bridge enzyme-like 13 n=1 Tax=Abeliophyllum distichum TaxID=126358 RepID=A0ABD1SXG3_9LAMI
MPRVKMAAKRTRSERPPSSSSFDEDDPQTKRIDRCPILIAALGLRLLRNFNTLKSPSVIRLPFFLKPPDTINVLTLKRMKIFKENGQWVAKSKGFDDESGPSTLPFEGEDIHNDEDAPPPSPPRPQSHRPSSSTSGFTFTKDYNNLLNGGIDSLASTVDGLQHAVGDLQNTAATIQTTVGGLQTSVDGITSMLHALHSYLGTGFSPLPLPEM